MRCAVSALLTSFLLVGVALASLGDRDWQFRICVNECLGSGQCPSRPMPPFSFVNWDYEEQSVYTCTTDITESRAEKGLHPLKYFGHWPFIRWFGLEEPASVVFSLLNPTAHLWFLGKEMWRAPFTAYENLAWIQGYAVVALNAWLASSCYHSKKTEFSTQYDLISALTLLVYGAAMSVAFVAKLGGEPWRRAKVTVVAGLGLGWAFQVLAMLRDRVGFSDHMNLCIGLVGATTCIWLVWIGAKLRSTEESERTVGLWCLLVQAWLMLASLLEILDFPPILRTFDAHSLWHAATVPLGFVWYRFLTAHALGARGGEKDC